MGMNGHFYKNVLLLHYFWGCTSSQYTTQQFTIQQLTIYVEIMSFFECHKQNGAMQNSLHCIVTECFELGRISFYKA